MVFAVQLKVGRGEARARASPGLHAISASPRCPCTQSHSRGYQCHVNIVSTMGGDVCEYRLRCLCPGPKYVPPTSFEFKWVRVNSHSCAFVPREQTVWAHRGHGWGLHRTLVSYLGQELGSKLKDRWINKYFNNSDGNYTVVCKMTKVEGKKKNNK